MKRWLLAAAPLSALTVGAVEVASGGASIKRPFVIAPVIEGLLYCRPAPNPLRHMIEAGSACETAGFDGAKALRRALDDLEPGGPRGEVQVGYTLTLSLLGLYTSVNSNWTIDEAAIDRAFDIVARVNRPAVIYLAANHFDTSGEAVGWLMQDKRNLMHLADGTVPMTTYFGHRIVPWTMLTDETIPVNLGRFGALRRVARKFNALPLPIRERVVAFALAGEIHQMFPDFEAGMGNHETVRTTDYSPLSVARFRAWLSQRYGGDLRAFSSAMGETITDFEKVAVPSRSVVGDAERKPGLLEHYDGFAAGSVPVFGWLWDKGGSVKTLWLYVNGKRHAPIETGFNRLDVYRVIKDLKDPNVGFRHALDYRHWPRGDYVLQVVADTASGLQEVGRTTLVVAAVPGVRDDAPMRVRGEVLDVAPFTSGQQYLDLPKTGQRVAFNPLALEWDRYREEQVRSMVERFASVAKEAGLPADRLYSHQILPEVNSTWNASIFATRTSMLGGASWKHGINLYGGAATGAWFERFLARTGIRDYAVPEFHPQQWRDPTASGRALELHRKLGARFVSPYYLSLTSGRSGPEVGQIKRLEIRPDNPLDGSDQLGAAIKAAASR